MDAAAAIIRHVTRWHIDEFIAELEAAVAGQRPPAPSPAASAGRPGDDSAAAKSTTMFTDRRVRRSDGFGRVPMSVDHAGCKRELMRLDLDMGEHAHKRPSPPQQVLSTGRDK